MGYKDLHCITNSLETYSVYVARCTVFVMLPRKGRLAAGAHLK